MIRDKDAKRYIYKAQPSVDADRLEVILAAIRERGRNIINRTHLHPELANLKGPTPLPEPPLGKAFILEHLGSINGDSTTKYIEALKATFLDAVLEKLSWYCRISFKVNLTPAPPPLNDPLCYQIVLENGKMYLALSSYSLYASDKPVPTKWLAAYQEVLSAGNLPIRVTYKRGNYEVEHTAGGDILADLKRQEGRVPRITGATLPGLSTAEILDRFRQFIHHPDHKTKGAPCWTIMFPRFRDPKIADSAELVEIWRTFNRLGFSSKKADATFWWHLRDYTMFREMPLMTKLMGDAAAQSLLAFEFGDGKKCQLDVLFDKKSKYHLMFSFDGPKDYAELAALLKIKLKEWE